MNTATATSAPSIAAPIAAPATRWDIDPAHTNAQFSVKHMMVTTVRGHFGKVSGSVRLDAADVRRSSVEVVIDASSIDTREPKRDAHLKSADFFDVEKFPQITFTSTKVEPAADGELKVTGDLTMHGVTKSIVLTVEALGPALKNPWGQVVRGTSATATVNRKDWGLNWNAALEAGGVLVGEKVQIQIDAELVEKA